MSKLPRQSKLRHVYAAPVKRDQCIDNIRVTRCSWDGTFCAANPKFVAVCSDACGGSSFIVIPSSFSGRVDPDAPVVAGHKNGQVLEIRWCPHNDNIIASAGEDGHVMLWSIPDEGLKETLTEPVMDLFGHQKKVGIIEWHPSAGNVLLSAGQDNKLIIWNCARGEPLTAMDFPSHVLSAAWNGDGSKLGLTFKDKLFRIMDVRRGEILHEVKAHEGAKPSLCIYIDNDRWLTTGFGKMAKRLYSLWDESCFAKPIASDEIDSSNGIMFPFYDADSGLLFFAGKGDSQIRYFEVNDEAPYVHFINTFMTNEPQRGIGWLPKRGVNVNNNELCRIYKLHAKGLCENLPFCCPRKSELFQEDLYPDCLSDVPSMTAEEWFAGANKPPNKISMSRFFEGDVGIKPISTVTKTFDFTQKATTEKQPQQATTNTPPPAAVAAPRTAPPAAVERQQLNAPSQQMHHSPSPTATPSSRSSAVIENGHNHHISNSSTSPDPAARVSQEAFEQLKQQLGLMEALFSNKFDELCRTIDRQNEKIAELESRVSSFDIV